MAAIKKITLVLGALLLLLCLRSFVQVVLSDKEAAGERGKRSSKQEASFDLAKHGLHEWMAADGRKMQAKFVGLEGENLVIDKNGASFTVPLATLAPVSVDLAKKLAASEKELAAKVLQFCEANLGRTVGDGECTGLSVNAMAMAGAASVRRDSPNRGDYVWGELVALIEADDKGVKGLEALSKVRAGDMVQFRDAHFQGGTHTGQRGTYLAQAVHHSAVVEKVDVAPAALKVFHQNSNGRRFVVRDTFYLADLRRGWLRIYRIQPAVR